jgi:RHS repeat-associated protein
MNRTSSSIHVRRQALWLAVPLLVSLAHPLTPAGAALAAGPSQPATAPAVNAEYVYDALGRRIAAVVDGQTTHFVYGAGLEVLEERAVDSAMLARYTYGAGLDEPLTMERAGSTFTYHRDAQGSIVALTEAAGALVEQYRYDAYGAPAFFDGGGSPLPSSALGNPVLFTGRRFDLETGNYDYRARAYNPALGRFLQTDLLGYAAGTLNLYQYVGDNPLRYVDPLGLDEEDKGFVETFIDNIHKELYKSKYLRKLATGSGTQSLAGKVASKTVGTAAGVGLQLLSEEGVEAGRGITQWSGFVHKHVRRYGDLYPHNALRSADTYIPEPPDPSVRRRAPPQPQPAEPDPEPCEEPPVPAFEDLSRAEQIAVLDEALRGAEDLTKRRYVEGASEAEQQEALDAQNEISRRLHKLLLEELREAEVQLHRAVKQGAGADTVRQATERRDQLRQREREVEKIRKFFETPRR